MNFFKSILFVYFIVGLSNMSLSLIMQRLRPNRLLTMPRSRLWSTAGNDGTIEDILARFRSKTSKISPYWVNQLEKVENPNARALIPLLLDSNAIGYELSSAINGTVKKTKGLFDVTLDEKNRFPECIILMRCGEFYETYGVDAVMMVEHAGLNPMGGRARAGCPVGGVQNTLNRLTDAGLTVAVYEEVLDVEKNKNKQKRRVLQQIVSQASRNYLHDISLNKDTTDFKVNRPIVGILQSIGFDGYSLYEYHADEKKVTITERLTPEAVLSIIESTGCIEPIYIQSARDKRFLTDHYQVEELRGYDDKDFFSQVKARCSRRYEMNVNNVQVHRRQYQAQARPIYTSTALQVGLKNNRNVPDLIKSLLPRNYDEYTSRFLRDWLLIPPPHHIADHMQSLNRLLMSLDSATPKFTPTSLGKVVSLLTSGEANPQLFRDIHRNIYSLLQMLTDPALRPLVEPLLALTSHESGIPALHENLVVGCDRVLNSIEAVVAKAQSVDGHNTDPNGKISEELFKRNEEEYRGQVAEQHPQVQELYCEIRAAALALCQAVAEDFPPLGECEVKYEALNNAIYYVERKPSSRGGGRGKKTTSGTAAASAAAPVSSVVSSAETEEDSENGEDEEEAEGGAAAVSSSETVEGVGPSTDSNGAGKIDYKKNRIHFVDRKGKSHATKWTTARVNEALKEYLTWTESAPAFIKDLLRGLCQKLIQDTDLVTIQQATHWAVILTAARLHTASARQKQWCLPTLLSTPPHTTPAGTPCLSVTGLSPYWIDRDKAVLNDVTLRGLFLLTAPNMSGKSTLMRSLLVTALLASCGLYVPCSSAEVPRYDNFFLRTSSYDVPQEGKSAFALEMDDLRVVLRDCTSQSLVMIDEFGKGTSSKDGSGLSGALLETLDEKRVSGIFATHLHELFHLPLRLSDRVQNKRMGLMIDDEDSELKWTYQLEDGKCTDSMALVTAKEYSISPSIIRRAEQLIGVFDKQCRPSSDGSTLTTDGDGSQEAVTVLAAEDFEKMQSAAPNSAVAAATATPSAVIDVRESQTDFDGDEGEWERSQYRLDRDVLPLLSEVTDKIKKTSPTGVKDAASSSSSASNAVLIEADQDPPVSLEGSSCVYVLHIHKPNAKSSYDRFYVGETESMMQRLRRHREGYSKEGYSVNAVAVRVSNKSEARNVETMLIKRLKSKGFDIEGGSDESHSLFGGRR